MISREAMCLGGYFCAQHHDHAGDGNHADDNFNHAHGTHLFSGGLEFDRPVIKTSARVRSLYHNFFRLQKIMSK